MVGAWVGICKVEELAPGTSRAFRRERHHVAVFRLEDGSLYAVENRCPHEGYPLTDGYTRGPILVCAWHAFRFDLRDGRCLVGDEPVRVYPVRERDQVVEIDLTPPDAERERARIFESLREGVLDERMGQVARDVFRLRELDVPIARIAAEAARLDGVHGRYGTGHALPVAIDAIDIARRRDDPMLQAAALLQAFEMAADDCARLPARPQAKPATVPSDPDAAGAAIAAAVEEERFADVDALVRGAVRAGFGREHFERWLLSICSRHFVAFGHGLIYATKVFELLDDPDVEDSREAVLPALFLVLTGGTRHDRLPPMRRAMPAVDAIADRFETWIQNTGRPDEPLTLAEAVLAGPQRAVVPAIAAALDGGAAPREVAKALNLAAAIRLLRFDVDVDADPAVQEGWLDVIHLQSYTNAVRKALDLHPHAETLRMLFFSALFIQQHGPLDLSEGVRTPLDGGEPDLAAIEAALRTRDGDAAVRNAAAYLASGGPYDALRQRMEEIALLDQGVVAPIFAAHVVKSTRAAFEDAAEQDDPATKPLPVLAALRFQAAPRQERRLSQAIHEAHRFVALGKVPRRRSER